MLDLDEPLVDELRNMIARRPAAITDGRDLADLLEGVTFQRGGRRSVTVSRRRGTAMAEVTLLYFDGCPNWRQTDGHLQRLQGERTFELRYRRVETPEEAARLGFAGSPTVLLDGVDPFATGDEPTGLACRVYTTPHGPQGSPTLEQLREVLR
jgi:hypothetical protein